MHSQQLFHNLAHFLHFLHDLEMRKNGDPRETSYAYVQDKLFLTEDISGW